MCISSPLSVYVLSSYMYPICVCHFRICPLSQQVMSCVCLLSVCGSFALPCLFLFRERPGLSVCICGFSLYLLPKALHTRIWGSDDVSRGMKNMIGSSHYAFPKIAITYNYFKFYWWTINFVAARVEYSIACWQSTTTNVVSCLIWYMSNFEGVSSVPT